MTIITAARFERPHAKATDLLEETWEWSKTPADRQTVLQACVGLPYRVDHNRPVNTASAPTWKFRMINKHLLKSWWGITSGEEAHYMLKLLADSDLHTPVFDVVLQAAEMLLSEFAPRDYRSQAFVERRRTVEAFLRHLAEVNQMDPYEVSTDFDNWLAVRTHPAFAGVNAPAVPSTTRAWDLMRVEIAGATSALVGYLTAEEYAGYAQRAVAELQKSFSSWAEAAASYWWGRAIWIADNVRDDAEAIQKHLRHFNHVITEALTDPNSPWRHYPLHG